MSIPHCDCGDILWYVGGGCTKEAFIGGYHWRLKEGPQGHAGNNFISVIARLLSAFHCWTLYGIPVVVQTLLQQKLCEGAR